MKASDSNKGGRYSRDVDAHRAFSVWLLFLEPRVLLEFLNGQALGRLDGKHETKGTLAIVGHLQTTNITLNFTFNLGVFVLEMGNENKLQCCFGTICIKMAILNRPWST